MAYEVLERSVHSGHRRQPTLTISRPASADCTAPSDFLCGGPDSLELTTDRVSCSVCWFFGDFKRTLKTIYSRDISAFSAIEMFA